MSSLKKKIYNSSRANENIRFGDSIILVLYDGHLKKHVVKIQIDQNLVFGATYRNSYAGMQVFNSVLNGEPKHTKINIELKNGSVNAVAENGHPKNSMVHDGNSNDDENQMGLPQRIKRKRDYEFSPRELNANQQFKSLRSGRYVDENSIGEEKIINKMVDLNETKKMRFDGSNFMNQQAGTSGVVNRQCVTRISRENSKEPISESSNSSNKNTSNSGLSDSSKAGLSDNNPTESDSTSDSDSDSSSSTSSSDDTTSSDSNTSVSNSSGSHSSGSDSSDNDSSDSDNGNHVNVGYIPNINWDNIHAKNDLCVIVSFEDIQKYRTKNDLNKKMSNKQVINFKLNEKRVMFRHTSNEEIRNVTPAFFKQKRDVIDVKVSHMSHARRFWLAMKFCRNNHMYPGVPSMRNVCHIFGISPCVIMKFKQKYGDNVLPMDLMYLTPIEREYRTQERFFREKALNYANLKHFWAKKKE